MNVSGYPKNRLLHQVTTRVLVDELIVRKVKDVFKLTPFYAASRRIYRKILEANLKKVEMAPRRGRCSKRNFRTMLPCWQSTPDFPYTSSGRIFSKINLLSENAQAVSRIFRTFFSGVIPAVIHAAE